MIGIRLKGRMGNQMFEYAFALWLTRKLNTTFFVKYRRAKFYLTEYFELPGYSPAYNWLKRCLFSLKHFFRPQKIHIDMISTPAENIKTLDKNDVMYVGYVQSEEYFKSVAAEVRRHFRVKPKYAIDARKYLALSDRPLLAIHVRLTDYSDFFIKEIGVKNPILPRTYYQEAYRAAAAVADYEVVVVSDDPQGARALIDLPRAKYVSSEMLVDFQIIMQADAVVCSNSSFAWWASYLSSAKNIFAPRYWLGFKIRQEFPNSVIPAAWHSVDFEP